MSNSTPNKVQSPLLDILPTSSSLTPYLFSNTCQTLELIETVEPEKVEQVEPKPVRQLDKFVQHLEQVQDVENVCNQFLLEPTLINTQQLLNDNEKFFQPRLIKIARSIKSTLTVQSQISISNIILKSYPTPSQLFTKLCQKQFRTDTDPEHEFSMTQIIQLIPKIYPNTTFGDTIDLFTSITLAMVQMNPNIQLSGFKEIFAVDPILFKHLISNMVERVIPNFRKVTINGVDIIDTIFQHYGQPNVLISNLLKHHHVTMERLEQLTSSIYPTRIELIKKEVDGVLSGLKVSVYPIWTPITSQDLYLSNLRRFCLYDSKNLSQSVFPVIYNMSINSSFIRHVQTAHDDFQHYLSNMDKEGFRPSPYNFRQTLSQKLSSNQDIEVQLVHHQLFGSLGFGPTSDVHEIAPKNISILFPHFLPIYLASIHVMEQLFSTPSNPIIGNAFFNRVLTASNTNNGIPSAAFFKVKEQCYDLYSPPIHHYSPPPMHPYQTNPRRNVFTLTDGQGLGKSELMKIPIITALALGKKVLVFKVRGNMSNLICIDPESKDNDEVLISTVQIGQKSYSEYVDCLKIQIQDAFSKFGQQNTVVVIEPLEWTTKHEDLKADTILSKFDGFYQDLAQKYPDVMFCGAHSTTNVTNSAQNKAANTLSLSSAQLPTMVSLGTYLSFEPILQAYRKLIQLLQPHSDLLHSHSTLLASNTIQRFCLPTIRSVLSFIHAFVDQQHNISTLYTIHFNDRLEITSPLPLGINSELIKPVIRSLRAYSYNQFSDSTTCHLSSLIQQRDHLLKTVDTLSLELQFYQATRSADSSFDGIPIKQCYDLDRFGDKDKLNPSPKLAHSSIETIIIPPPNTTTLETINGSISTHNNNSTHQLECSYSVKTNQSASTAFPVDLTSNLVTEDTFRGLHYKSSRLVDKNDITALYSFASQLASDRPKFINNNDQIGVFVRLPKAAAGLDFLFMKPTTKYNSSNQPYIDWQIDAIQHTITTDRQMGPIADTTTIYSTIFTAFLNDHESRLNQPPSTTLFTPYLYHPTKFIKDPYRIGARVYFPHTPEGLLRLRLPVG